MTGRWVAVLGLIAACRPVAPAQHCTPDVPGAVYRCGRIIVPESRNAAGAGIGDRSVALEYVVFPANRAPRRSDAIAYFADAAGESAFLGLLEIREWQLEGLDRDLIVLEQRGGGYSTPSLACGRDAVGPRAVGRCRDSLTQSGVDLTSYTAAEAAADYRDLLDSLGVLQANLIGHGAGAPWALAFARRYPERVRSIVLDAPAPGGRAPAIDVLGSLERLVAECHEQAACRTRYPDPKGQLSRVVEQRQSPGPGQPTAAGFIDMVRSGLVDHAKLGGLLAGLEAADRGDWTTAAGLLQLGADIPEGIAMTRMRLLGARWSFGCASRDATPVPVGIWPKSLLQVVGDIDQLEEAQCNAWWQGRARPHETGLALSSHPTLVLAGQHDPAAGEAHRLAAGAGRALLVEVPATGHRALVHRCPRDLIQGFLADPTRPVDEGCVRRMQPVHFQLR